MTFRRGLGRLLFATVAAIAVQAQAAPKATLAEPSLSPDGAEIAFVSGGDIWTVPAAGGTAALLVTDQATEGRPLYSPDGRELAFTSTRAGAANVYVLTLSTGKLRRLTFSDANEQLDGWSRDGKWLYISGPANDVARQNDVYRVAATGGTPLEVSRERYLNEFNSAPSPDGQSIALMAKGISSNQWWRNGHSHIDEAELWLKPVAANAPYRKLLGATSKRLWPMWGADGRALWFMSDEGGTENLWRMGLDGGAPQQVTRFTDGRVLFPSIGYDGKSIVFEREFEIWKLDVATGAVAKVPVALRGAPAAAGERRLVETSFRSLSLSPDGKKLAVIAHGEVFAAPAKDGGQGQRLTETPGAESDLAWSPDSRRLAYVAERGRASQVMEYDFATQKERPLTEASDVDAAPVYSPDGKMLAYVHGTRQIRVIALGAGGPDRLLFEGALDRNDGAKVAWSPDSKWLAFGVTDPKSFRNVWVIPIAGGQARPISFLANGNAADLIAWSPDGKYVVFDSGQRSEPSKLVRVDLLPNTPKYREDAFRDLFKAASPGAPTTKADPKDKAPAAKPAASEGEAKAEDETKDGAPAAKGKIPVVRIVFEGIRERATLIPLGGSADEPVISPDGKTLVYRVRQGDQQNLFSYSLDELAKEPAGPQQLTGGRRAKRDYAFSPDSKQLYYLDGGRVSATPIETPKPRFIDVTGEMVVRFDAEKQVVFEEAWSTLNRAFYDDKFHGQDWTALRARFEPFAQGAQTPDELRRVINLMIGELNASHSGINRPAEGFGAQPASRVGDLGLRFDREAYEAGRGLVVREVIALGPADIEGSIKPGDVLTAVDGKPVGAGVNLDSVLLDRAGKRTVLTVSGRQAVVRPVAPGVAAGLLYRHWVNDRRAYVEKASGGRLGYVHILDMSSDSLDQLYLDLDAQNQGKDGVVIDVRNNNGGFINGYVLDVFSRKNFLTMTPRGLFAVPSRQNLGQRALGSPTILVTNESSLSDAEDFAEGYRYLGLGKVVGVPTAGWIIYTGGQPLIDGSVVRVPFIRIQGADGKDMELNPRPVDITVERPLGETLSGRDSQLDTAVAELLKGLGPKRP
ncbi:MAG: PDZ domain-containing protein [Alphaproteobacteria bacterium]|nr:PDZ domain-containing protein [Alphaproteobacteria bacterium]MBU1513276.1 PDZ domain-containing protein [Alphaproteobacteria bacterium]MBU2093604.1 PDZ domain-containing protein [Alphaproteobacteria bacterium]MBU2151952.1 PDZ domain-containing protein [Alphaproteobacteria bacterium]MBU2307612.1 PDZ domain-containing protein [Alphaproteobacteria bacterium]